MPLEQEARDLQSDKAVTDAPARAKKHGVSLNKLRWKVKTSGIEFKSKTYVPKTRLIPDGVNIFPHRVEHQDVKYDS